MPPAWKYKHTGFVIGQYASPKVVVEYVMRPEVRTVTLMNKVLSL